MFTPNLGEDFSFWLIPVSDGLKPPSGPSMWGLFHKPRHKDPEKRKHNQDSMESIWAGFLFVVQVLTYPYSSQHGRCLEDHPRTCKWLGSPPCISHNKAIWKWNNRRNRGLMITMVMDHHWTNSWDDPPGWICGFHPRCVYKLNLSQLLAPRCAGKQDFQVAGPGKQQLRQWKSSRFFGADCAVDTTLQAGGVDDHLGKPHSRPSTPIGPAGPLDVWMCGVLASDSNSVDWHTAAAKKSQSSHNWSFQGILITECHGGGPPHGGLEGLVAAVEVRWSFILALTWSVITKPIWWAGFLTEENLTKPRRWQDDDKMASTRCCPNRWRFLPIGLSLQVILGRKGYPPKIPGGSPCISPIFGFIYPLAN